MNFKNVLYFKCFFSKRGIYLNKTIAFEPFTKQTRINVVYSVSAGFAVWNAFQCGMVVGFRMCQWIYEWKKIMYERGERNIKQT